MTEIIRLIALVALFIGIALIGLSIYMYIKNDIKKIKQELKSTRKVAAEKDYDSALTNSIYYKSEAEKVKSKELVIQPKGFQRQKERPARNDTGLLMKTAMPDPPTPKAENMQPAVNVLKSAERPAETHINNPAVKANTAPLEVKESHTTAPLIQNKTARETALLKQMRATAKLEESEPEAQKPQNKDRFTLPLE